MSKRYPKQQWDRAVRMVTDHLDEYDSLYRACKAIAPKAGVGVEALRRWVIQAQVDAGEQAGATSAEKARIKDLEREDRELREANEVLKAASVFFASMSACQIRSMPKHCGAGPP